MLSTGKLPLGGLPRNSVVRITDHPDMTSAVYRGRKATNRNKSTKGGVCLSSLPQKASYSFRMELRVSRIYSILSVIHQHFIPFSLPCRVCSATTFSLQISAIQPVQRSTV